MNISEYCELYRPDVYSGDLKNFTENCFFDLLKSYRNELLRSVIDQLEGTMATQDEIEILGMRFCELLVINQLISMESTYKIKVCLEIIYEDSEED